MHIIVNINLGPNEYASDLAGNATEIADKILKAVGGDEEKDTVNVQVMDTGYAGASMTASPPTPAPDPKEA